MRCSRIFDLDEMYSLPAFERNSHHSLSSGTQTNSASLILYSIFAPSQCCQYTVW